MPQIFAQLVFQQNSKQVSSWNNALITNNLWRKVINPFDVEICHSKLTRFLVVRAIPVFTSPFALDEYFNNY